MYPPAQHTMTHSLLRFPLAVTLWLLTAFALQCGAQTFKVRTFRQLPNDISAYISPVRDLNGEACALVKVVGDAEFAFSTPLGIVKRKDDVGETWLYLPKGSRMLTLKHPRWGVLRDYRFSEPLESRMTYELVVVPDVEVYQTERRLPPVDSTPTLHISALPPPPPIHRTQGYKLRRPREPWRTIIQAQAGLGQGNNPALGLRLALMRRHGAYIQVLADLHAMPSVTADCDRNGTLADGSGATPYYTGTSAEARRTFLAGAIHRITAGFCLYEGLGYGERRVAWQKAEGDYVRNTAYSDKGLCAELGAMYRFYDRLAVSAGVQTIGFGYWNITLGVGVHF